MGMLQKKPTDNLKPGDMVLGKGIFIGAFDDLVDAQGSSLGIKTNWYDAAKDLGKRRTFKDMADAVASCKSNDRGGLKLDPVRYEAELFEKLQSGEAIGKNVIAPLEVVKAISKLRLTGEYKRRSEDGNGTTSDIWQWSCTPVPGKPSRVRAVSKSGDDYRFSADYKFTGRVCFAELAL